MSYRLIDANNLSGKISEEDYKVVLDAPCIYADLPNGLDNEYHEIQKWIPVSERLPNVHEVVLTTYEVEDGSRIAITGYGKYGFLVGNVTAWMPLPEPYRAESEVSDADSN